MQEKKLQKLMKKRYSNKISYNDLVNLEAYFGATIFGPAPAGHRREFFNHTRNVWIWYDGWTDAAGKAQETTIRYEVRPAGVFKRVDGQRYEKISGKELDNFRLAAKNYLKLMKTKLYYS